MPNTLPVLAVAFAASLTVSPANAVIPDSATPGSGEQLTSTHVFDDGTGRMHLAYVSREKGKNVHDVFHAISLDGGHTWGRTADVSRTPGESTTPVLAGHGRDLAIVWIDTTSGADHPDVWGVTSADAGATWTAATDISKTPGVSSEPAVSVTADGSIHVVWLDTTDGASHPDIWHAQSRDHGRTWKRAENISRTPGVSSYPAIATGPKGEVYVTWADTTNTKNQPGVWFNRSLDGGTTWGKPIELNPPR